MRILTNPGSNLSPEIVARYGVALTPQKIVVDGVEHDTRDGVALETIDGWVRTAQEHPYVLGTSAAEYAGMFRDLAANDRQILAVMTSRKLIQSHAAAVAAARILGDQAAFADVEVAVADTGTTDVGAGLATILAGEADRAGVPLDRIAELLEAYREASHAAFAVETLDYLVKGGRATAMRAFIANLFQIRPLIAFEDGELKAAGKIPASADPTVRLAAYLAAAIGGRQRRVWAGIFHGNAPEKARRLADQLRERFDVAFLYSRPLSPSIYLHGGPGSVGATVVPLDALPWQPPGTPPV